MAVAHRSPVAAVLVAALVVAGCGATRVVAPSLTTASAPEGFTVLGYPADGFALKAPVTWLPTQTIAASGGVVSVSSGPAVISLWHYPRSGGALTGAAALDSARDALIGAAKAKDSSLQVLRSSVTTVDGAGAVILSGTERVGGQLRRVRSEHVYAAGAEIVLDEYAPPAQFASVDHDVFSPVRKSLTLLHPGSAS